MSVVVSAPHGPELSIPEAFLDWPAVSPATIRPLTVDEYRLLCQSGAFEDQRTELLAGMVVNMMAQGPVHLRFMTLMTRLLARRLTSDFMVTPSATYPISRYSAPEPDFAIVTSSSVWNPPQRAVWLIEIAYSSQELDLGFKAKLYARGGIPEYWVIDAATSSVRIHRDPGVWGYGAIEHHAEHVRVAPKAIPSLAFSIAELLGDRVDL